MNETKTTRHGGVNLWLVSALVLTLVFALGVYIFGRSYFIVDELTVPDFVGMPHAEATVKLRDIGLEPISFLEQVAGVPSGTVTSQSIAPGTQVKSGRTIHLGVNNPPQDALIPRLVGLERDEALTWLDDLNVPVGEIEYVYADSTAGIVIGQRPEAGTLLGDIGAVFLTVSSGLRAGELEIPDVVGSDINSATERLKTLGFTQVELVAQDVSSADAETVLAMHPEAGTFVVASTPVVLSYAASTAIAVQVPELSGLSLRDAQRELLAANLRVGHVTEVSTTEFPPGIVQYAPNGFTLPETEIAITLNRASGEDATEEADFDDLLRDLENRFGREETSEPEPSTPAEVPEPRRGSQLVELPPEGDGARIVNFAFDPTFLGIPRLLQSPYELELVIQDDRGERTLFKTMAEAGRPVSSLIPVYGDNAMLQTYIDGVFFQAWSP